MDWLTLIVAMVLSLLITKFFPSYFLEKGKNLATKEDISFITEEIEKVKFNYTNEDKILEKRREIYEEITSSLRIFISGHNISEEQKVKFYEAYAMAWLWAPDEVIKKLNIFIDGQIKKEEMSQETMKKQYGNIILAMRKDVGFSKTKNTSDNYIFATFGN